MNAMSRIALLLTITGLGLGLAAVARADTLTVEEVRLHLQDFARDRLPPSVLDVTVEDLSLDEPQVVDGIASLRIRPGANEDFIGRVALLLDVVSENHVVATRNVSFRVRGEVPVWTVAVPLQRGQRIDGSSLGGDVRDLDSLPADAILQGEVIADSDAARNLAVGTVLCRSMLDRRPDLPRHAQARIVLSNGVLTVTCAGEMMQDGFVGEPVRARCGRTAKVITGELRPGGFVYVQLPDAALATLFDVRGGVR